MGRPRRKKAAANTSVINVKINENNEIEYMEVDDQASEEEDGDHQGNDIHEIVFEPDDEDDDDDDEEELIPNEDGTMSIKLSKKKPKRKQVVEHVCAKCSKTYASLQALKRHLNLCRNLPKDETISTEDKDFSTINVTESKYETVCFCCNEDKSTAHVRYFVYT